MNDGHDIMQRDSDDVLDQALRSELRWETPPELTACLLGLVPQYASSYLRGTDVPPLPSRPKPWVTALAMALTAIVIGVSLGIAQQLYNTVGAQLGIVEQWQQMQAAGLWWLYQDVPFMRYVVALLGDIRDQLHWLLLAAVLWLALDGWSPSITFRRQQQAS